MPVPQRVLDHRLQAVAVAVVAFLIASVVIYLDGSSAGVSSTTLTPVADAAVRSSAPTTNYGTATRMSAQKRSSDSRTAYLRFDVRPAPDAVVTKATLRVYATTAGSAAGIDLQPVADTTWQEKLITYANAPPITPTKVSHVASYSKGTWVTLDATSLVVGAGLVSVALTTVGTTEEVFGTREDLAHVPQLIVETTEPTTTTAATTTTTSPPPAPSGSLHATATDSFVQPDGTAVRVNAVNVIPVWSSPGSTWDAAKYQQIHDKGFNAVRFVLYWDDFEPNAGSFDTTSLATLDTAIARAKGAGLYVVLDAIHLWGNGGFNDVPVWARSGDSVTTVATNGTGYLKMLATRYRGEASVIAYDLVNEFYRYPIDQNGVLRAYDGLITAVRTVDPDKIVIIEPTYGDTSVGAGLADFANLTNRRNVVWSIHDYFAGGDDDGYAADGSQIGNYVWNGTNGYPVPDAAALERHLLVHLDTLRGVGLPVWVGEFGIGDAVANHDRWIDDQVGLFEKYRLGRSWWEYFTAGPFSATNADFSWKPWVDRLLAPVPPDTTAPAAPTGLSATGGNGTVELRWADNTEPDLAGYRVYRANADSTWPATALATTTSSSFVDTGRTNGVSYSYRTTAIDRATPANESPPSASASATPAPATTSAVASFGPVADTYSRSDTATTNYGTSVRFSAQNGSQIRVAYLRFNVQLPAGAVATKATLRIYPIAAGSAAGVDLRSVADNTWDELTLTSANAPTPGATAVTNAANFAINVSLPVDASPLVRGSGMVSMALTTTGSTYQGFSSREDTANPPRLDVEFATSPPTGADTSAPAPPAGLQATAGYGTVALDWADNTEPDLDGYRVYRANPDGTWPAIPTGVTRVSAFTDSGLTNGTAQTYRVTAFDTAAPANESAPSTTVSATPSALSTGDPIVAAAGDIACPGLCGQGATATLMSDIVKPQAVLGLGDYQYETGTLANFGSYYEPSWGKFKASTWAISGGTHDFYGTGDYLSYFNAGGPVILQPEGSYSYDIGAWHVIALNSYCFERTSCDEVAVTNWLKSDLAAHPSTCTLAYFHQPYWTSTSSHTRLTTLKPWIQALYDANADIVLQAHNHFYERFAPQDPNDVADVARGLTAFVVGTGGRSHDSITSTAVNSVASNTDTFGVLKLTLHPTSADFQFAPEAGKSFTDGGTVTCH